MVFIPAYLKLLKDAELQKRVDRAAVSLSNCSLCGHACKVDRLNDERGVCRTGSAALISSYGPHHGEENPLRGRYGSGTIFFSRCNLNCQYCQNHDISQTNSGREITPAALAEIMLELQDAGCHNINLVSPTHVIPPVLSAILIGAKKGLCLPIVYNTGGFDSLEALQLLNGIIDIYMPDMKYTKAEYGLRYSKAKNYPEVNQRAVREMHRQVGNLILDKEAIALRGLLVRHLVLPNNLSGSKEIIRFLSENISKNTYLNIMDQYRPCFQAGAYPELNRPITRNEYTSVLLAAHEAGMSNLDQRLRFI